MKNHFFIPYFGNKRKEVEEIYNEVKDSLTNIKFIIEPYCGSSAFSYYIWLNNKDNDLTYVLNDNNKMLIDLYNISKSPEKFEILYNSIIDIQRATTNKQLYDKVFKNSVEDLASWIYVNKVYCIRAGLYPLKKTYTEESFNAFKNAPIIEFLRNAKIIISDKEAIEVYNEYKGNDKALIFLDPPYLVSCNSFYNNPKVNVYEYLFDNEIMKEKALIVLCLENIWIIKLLFKGKKMITYDKTYSSSKKKTEHVIIINKNI